MFQENRLSGSKVTAFFSKSIFAKILFFHQIWPSTVPEQGAFWETKNIFGNHYPITLKNAQKTRIVKQFFLSDRLSTVRWNGMYSKSKIRSKVNMGIF